MPSYYRPLLLLLAVLTSVPGCTTRVIVEQPKPLDININFTGHLDLVIHDARENLEQITGEKPTNVVRPEDIGLPPASGPGAQTSAIDDFSLASGGWEEATMPIMWRSQLAAPAMAYFLIATEAELKQSMAARNAQIQALWYGKLVGESHSGLLAPKGTLTPEQQALVAAENADRTALYAAESQRRKITPDEVALGYLLARLGYAKSGVWYEKMNAEKQWEWKQWGQ